ncbi:Heavy metal tolerance protein [Verticillium dahliae VDG1]|nr:Heavy metal tolerance protein [Verticillium dahliae VDG1]
MRTMLVAGTRMRREQDALLEALQDPLRRDAALHMLQERSRAAAAMNDSDLGQQQTDMPIKQEERRHSDVSSWNNFDDMRASSGSPLQGFTSSSTTRPMVATTPQMAWTTTGPSMRPDTSVTSGMETGAFQAPATTAAFAGQLGHFVHSGNDSEPSPLQQQMPMGNYPDGSAAPLPFRMQNNDWNKDAASSQMSSQPWMGASPAMPRQLANELELDDSLLRDDTVIGTLHDFGHPERGRLAILPLHEASASRLLFRTGGRVRTPAEHAGL